MFDRYGRSAVACAWVTLAAALPAVYFYNHFTNRVKHFAAEMDDFSLALPTTAVAACGAADDPRDTRDISGVYWATAFHPRIQLVGGGELPFTGATAGPMLIAGIALVAGGTLFLMVSRVRDRHATR